MLKALSYKNTVWKRKIIAPIDRRVAMIGVIAMSCSYLGVEVHMHLLCTSLEQIWLATLEGYFFGKGN